jgi:hypothetical protein
MNCRRKSIIRQEILVVSIVLLVCGCAWAQETRSNAMPGTDFSKYHTYKWVAIQENVHPDQIVDAQIKQAVDAQLSSKGLTKTDNDKADMYVAYQTAVDQEKQWNASGMGGVSICLWGEPGSAPKDRH